MLKEIFEKQRELNIKIAPKMYDDATFSKLRRNWIKDMLLALDQEKSEAIDSLNWKWWKHQEDDWENLQVELVDMLHFLVSAMQIAGMTADNVYELYIGKNKLNHKRQDEGYKTGEYEKFIDGVEDNKQLFKDYDEEEQVERVVYLNYTDLKNVKKALQIIEKYNSRGSKKESAVQILRKILGL